MTEHEKQVLSNMIDSEYYSRQNPMAKDEVLANIRANVCEWAVAKLYNISWNVPWYPNELHPLRHAISDVGFQCEVRSVRTARAVPFWEKDMNKLLIATKCLDEATFSQQAPRVSVTNSTVTAICPSSLSCARTPQ